MPSTPIDFSVKPPSWHDVANKNVLITGGASGLGLKIAVELAIHGAYVTIADIDREGGTKVEDAMKEDSGAMSEDSDAMSEDTDTKFQYVQTDVTSWPQQLVAFKKAMDFHPKGALDLVIPCAGVISGSIVPNAETKLDEDPVEPDVGALDINLKGVYYTVHLALHYFARLRASKVAAASNTTTNTSTSATDKDNASTDKKDEHKPHIILLASLTAYGILPRVPAYTASKWGLRGLFKVLRPSTAVLGVRLNMVAPTFVEDAGIITEGRASNFASIGIRTAKVADVVYAVMWMASDKTIDGRSVVVAPAALGSPEKAAGDVGSANFDILDDVKEMEGMPRLLKAFADGVFGENVETQLCAPKADLATALKRWTID